MAFRLGQWMEPWQLALEVARLSQLEDGTGMKVGVSNLGELIEFAERPFRPKANDVIVRSEDVVERERIDAFVAEQGGDIVLRVGCGVRAADEKHVLLLLKCMVYRR